MSIQAVRVLFKGEVLADYGQFVVGSDDFSECELFESFAGQEGVGLCGANTPGELLVATGMRHGGVGVTVELHDSAPGVDGSWEEIVEVSYRPLAERTQLKSFNGEVAGDLELTERDYRVRCSATGMHDGFALNNRDGGEPVADHYLLQFWPAEPEPARSIKRTSNLSGNPNAD
ncbi:hypothetical protein GCM10010435_26790 [Winogradskya consettensis]|uniref:Uncharacterized protein n=1 Tax=Winogradskya consettensis TaxID=113560 RepID=A0A919SAL4_9ACTN|nr:hypothetical protein [Actinoplanes consettensis]GIM68172.1 hypothetical protein Aco04nite_09580 [Actinoplanes consettensis]